MNRRTFLSRAAHTAGYTVLVQAGALAAGPDRDWTAQFRKTAPPPDAAKPGPEPHMTLVDLSCDVLVAGGGMSGVCAAIAAARNGARVVLLQDRSRLGGNASSEVKMHIVGANGHGARPGWREGGLIEEFRLDDAVNNPHRSWELWDLLLYDKILREPNIALLLDTSLCSAEVKRSRIERVLARSDKTEHIYRISARIFLDCTGDSRLGLEAGADLRVGREDRQEFKEMLGRQQADKQTLGSSILFTARNYGRPIPFTPPPWARKVTKEQLKFRPVNSWEYGYWWIEWGGQIDSIRDNERIRFELLAIVLGVWDYIKNSGNHPSSANWGMDWLGMMPGKRESRRLMGDHILTQADVTNPNAAFDDAVAIGGWPLDDHPPSGFDSFNEKPFTSIKVPDVYHIPFRCLYSRNIENLMMAGRNISVSHVALTSTRVMATCSVIGQAAGTGAAVCVAENLTPRKLYQDKNRLAAFQQRLLRDDQTIKNLKNADPGDLARAARAVASSEFRSAKAENVLNGLVRDTPGQWDNRWAALMVDGGVWLELQWDSPQTIRQVQITFDTGFQRELTLSSSDSVSSHMIRAPQPETVKDYELTYTDAEGKAATPLLKVEGNYQRLRRHQFEPIKARALRIHVSATHGSDTARVFEIRCYS